MHGKGLSGWLAARHLPLAIGEAERDSWMLRMGHAIEHVRKGKDLREILETPFCRTANFMRNRMALGAGPSPSTGGQGVQEKK